MFKVSMNEDECITLPDGRKLGFAEYGEPKGKPVFFFHGWPSSRLQAAYLDKHASERDIRIIAPDRPGIGQSDPLPHRRFSDWPADVSGLADALEIERISIFGVSGGGPYTLAACSKLSDRIDRAAIVCGAPPLKEKDDRTHMHWAYRTLSGLKSFRRAAMPALIPLSKWMIQRGSKRPPMSWMLSSVPARDRDAIHSGNGWDMVTRSYLEAVANGPQTLLTEGELYVEDWDINLEDIRVPVRFWHGLADANLPCEVAKKLASKVPNSEGCWVEGEGHYSLPVYHSTEVLDWLNE